MKTDREKARDMLEWIAREMLKSKESRVGAVAISVFKYLDNGGFESARYHLDLPKEEE